MLSMLRLSFRVCHLKEFTAPFTQSFQDCVHLCSLATNEPSLQSDIESEGGGIRHFLLFRDALLGQGCEAYVKINKV